MKLLARSSSKAPSEDTDQSLKILGGRVDTNLIGQFSEVEMS